MQISVIVVNQDLQHLDQVKYGVPNYFCLSDIYLINIFTVYTEYLWHNTFTGFKLGFCKLIEYTVSNPMAAFNNSISCFTKENISNNTVFKMTYFSSKIPSVPGRVSSQGFTQQILTLSTCIV